MRNLLLSLDNISRIYKTGKTYTAALTDISLDIGKGEKTVITGPSGSGKSTLLNLLGKLDRPDRGRIEYAGDDITYLTGKKASAFRREKIGFIFQDDALVPELTVIENVEIPLVINGYSFKKRRSIVMEILRELGLSEKYSSYPANLSGGERQRVSVARAVVHSPELILADEPTANLDSDSADAVISAIDFLASSGNSSVIITTHDDRVINRYPNRIKLLDGRIIR